MNKYWAIALLVSFVAWSGFMYYEGYSKEAAVCAQADAKHDLAQADVTVAAQAGVIDQVKKDQTVTNEVSNDYEKNISAINADYDAVSWVQRASTATGDGMPALPSTTGGHNAAACTNGLSDTVKERLLKSARNAQVQTARLVACQAFLSAHQPH